jgi:cytochrome c biogenesis protein CcmG, thiol:disulfide interchange protein DsbE
MNAVTQMFAFLLTAGLLVACSSAPATTIEQTSVDPTLRALIDAASLEECPERSPGVDAAIPGLPPVILPCLGDGPAVDLALVRGTPLVVNVWASWCPPCVAEMPMLAEAARDFSPDVRFLGIDLQDRADAALTMLHDLDVPFASVVDEIGVTRSGLSVSGPPVTFFVTADGVIAGRWDGLIPNREVFDGLMDSYLGIRL